MSPNTRKRAVLYGLGVLVIAGLAYGGFVYESEPDFEQLVASAEVCASYGTPDQGIEYAERGLRMRPNHRYLHLVIARCYERKGDWDRVAEYYQRAFDLSPVDDGNRWLLALHPRERRLAA